MKRLFRIGSGLFIYSIIPILSWIVLSYILGDNRIANVFSLTYAIQFVWLILRSFFGSGANVRKEKENNPNSVWNSIFWGTIFSILIFAIPLIFVDKYIAFFGQDVEFYRIYVIYVFHFGSIAVVEIDVVGIQLAHTIGMKDCLQTTEAVPQRELIQGIVFKLVHKAAAQQCLCGQFRQLRQRPPLGFGNSLHRVEPGKYRQHSPNRNHENTIF